MTARQASLLICVMVYLLSGTTAAGQKWNDNVEVNFGIMPWDPVTIKTDERASKPGAAPTIRFTALNSTWYPFKLAVDFEVFENLFPKPSARPFLVMHGPLNMFSFSQHVPQRGYGYNYKYHYWLAPSTGDSEGSFPYLMPVAEGRLAQAGTEGDNRISDSFRGEKGDTVFCMRRGTVVAVPRHENLDFRLSPFDCLEVMHEDLTYMVYENISDEKVALSPGQVILPGDPVATFSDKGYLKVTLLEVVNDSNMVASKRYIT